MMAYVREQEPNNADSFSYLYFANVLGAMTGTILAALVLVEVLGFHYTLAFAAAGNLPSALSASGSASGTGRHGRRPDSPRRKRPRKRKRDPLEPRPTD
jgi:hypothetical protein